MRPLVELPWFAIAIPPVLMAIVLAAVIVMPRLWAKPCRPPIDEDESE
jgi:hypothetical protein